jgi:hypothetical protein
VDVASRPVRNVTTLAALPAMTGICGGKNPPLPPNPLF